jgi:prepilin-type N-terminal cleavage/methylation domain-containing protein/prepilin-type processing-associated H-X9-DG protein
MRSKSQLRAESRAGMTLIELLVVLAIIGTLVALILPAVQAARESSRRAQCQNNLRQLATAMDLHSDQDRGYPIGCIGCMAKTPVAGEPPVPLRFIAWNVQLLPHLEETALWRQFDFSNRSFLPPNKAVGTNVLSVFLCPSTESEELFSTKGLWKGMAFTDYGGIYGVEGPGHDVDSEDANVSQWLRHESLGVMLYEEAVTRKQVTDGLSKTASVGEASARRLSQETEWVNGHNVFAQEASTPINGPAVQINEIGSPHPGGASLAFCDGRVEFVAEAIDQTVLNAMLTKAGGE